MPDLSTLFRSLLSQRQTCTFCSAPGIASNIPVCPLCKAALPWAHQRGETLDELSAFYYEPPIGDYILAGKTAGQLDKLNILGDLLTENLSSRINRLPEAIIPVPLHRKRLRKRGFNQSIELARLLADTLGIPLLTEAIERQRDTKEQKHLNATERESNMAQAFRIKQLPPYQHVAIFDDVVTTGSTCRALRNQLRAGGIETVEIWCCATTKQ